ncbi:TMEM165/GDT1 family protein [Vibrio hannami]|uniref:TMEM165/GDT1 family protein n=1 Tax=Vibrio hannami TaxID=2717094 RepID=UPI00240FCDE3|nr:TMEM165/GDT1 family protein [Vibrio hannami]MDG3085643.1 TMEM165/GDT1 family protein [Vibrio hannami]
MSIELLTTSALSFGMIFLAEIGDKSQIVCMTLAARHKAKPVIFGSIAAFGLLNLLAVTLGTGLAHIIPHHWLVYLSAALFLAFGLSSIFSSDGEDEGENTTTRSSKSVFFSTFTLIFLAELADKTQLAVVTLSTTHSAIQIWLTATLALSATSVLGVLLGRKLLARINPSAMHKMSGFIFILFAVLLLFNN